ncbi:SDR family oxidoreductase [Mesorhizobium sp.]|uniref:SDR family NAD(P)-dependent oxidoreductase n=1 Tax=Mesorhizobium sp. TaxID=1871066 RepID=UPI000FE5DDC6|nr:SDR family oxidoreductase [Mesorhizobium sp.]RWI72199.1 MAG: SDR family oxidoreductase [Mesorhizobium sp.]
MSAPLAIVTGATGGIGGACVTTLLRDGWRVLATGLGGSPEPGGSANTADLFLDADLTDKSAPDRVVKAALDSFGRVDGLVHCAGTSRVAAFLDQTDDDWDRVIEINLSAAHRMARSVGKAMVSMQQRGAMVMISSIAWLSGGANPAYGASKGGLNSVVFNIAQALGPHGIRANAIAPGIIATEMVRNAFPGGAFERLDMAASARTPLRRLGQAEEVAEVAAFLLSERASFVNGAVVPVTGGIELLPPIGMLAGSLQ